MKYQTRCGKFTVQESNGKVLTHNAKGELIHCDENLNKVITAFKKNNLALIPVSESNEGIADPDNLPVDNVEPEDTDLIQTLTSDPEDPESQVVESTEDAIKDTVAEYGDELEDLSDEEFQSMEDELVEVTESVIKKHLGKCAKAVNENKQKPNQGKKSVLRGYRKNK